MARGQLNTVDESVPDAGAPGADAGETGEPEAEAPQGESTVVTLEDSIAAATSLLEANGFLVRKRTEAQRKVLEKADPDAVKAYFESTGLNRKELADILGLTVSVIATVQNPNGDRWSQGRFELAQKAIDLVLAQKAELAAAAADAVPSEEAEAETEPEAEAEEKVEEEKVEA